jgi:NAD(P)-dependent dehydrogenase (short-subunit alcohol dehydrogenase family)
MGAATARRLAAAGARVVIADQQPADDVAAEIGGKALVADVASAAAMEEAAAEAASFGPLRVVVHCAATGAPPARLVDRAGRRFDAAGWARTIEVNLTGTFNVLVAAAAAMSGADPVDEDGQRGVVVTVSSTAGLDSPAGAAPYVASKAGVVALSETAARDLAVHGIRVVCIAPGPVDTPMYQGIDERRREGMNHVMVFPQRPGRADEFARLACHIVDNDFLNATCIRLDGGFRTNH